MTDQQITASDIAGWDSLQDIADSLEKRGLRAKPDFGAENELVLQLDDDEFITLVRAGVGESATDFKPKDADRRHTNLVATTDFEEFTFITRVRTFGQQHGQIKHQKLSFKKSQFISDGGEKNTILQKLNQIEYGSPAAIYGDLYDTQQIVKAFYEEFEELRTELVQEVSGIPDDRGDAKQRYVQITLDRMIFLYFIQEKRLLDRNLDYLHKHHEDTVSEGEDVYEEFYDPLFFDLLAEGNRNPDFGSLPYLNGGLFTKNPVEEEFPDAKLGDSTAETNELFGRILDFLSEWNWNVDERLDIVDPKNLSPAVLGHIFEQTVNQKEMGAYYTPEEITGFMSRRSIHPYLLDQLNEAVDADYEKIDEVFALSEAEAPAAEGEAVADGGTITQQAPTSAVQTEHVETLYFDILQDVRVLDPAVGSGAFLLAAQDVLLDVYLQCLEFFEELDASGQSWELSGRTLDELEHIQDRKGSKTLYAKREIILNNLYGVDIDDGAVEICKLRLWLSMVADIENEPNEVEPLPNIDFNIRQGNSLIGFTELVEVANEDGDAKLTNYGGGNGPAVKEMYEDVIEAIERHRDARSATEASNARNLAESRIETHSETLDEKVLDQFREARVKDADKADIEAFHPFHWVLEFAPVYQNGGFDVIIGNPPWEVLSSNRDDFFSKYDETFRTYGADKKDEVQERLLAEPDVRKEWEKYQDSMDQRASYFNNSQEYELQSPKVSGQAIASENDLSGLFLERVFKVASNYSYVSLILPGFVFSGAVAKDLRSHLLENTDIDVIIGFENKGIFEAIHNQYRFGIVSFRNSGNTQAVNGTFDQNDAKILQSIDERAMEITRQVLEQYSPEARIFPSVSSQTEASVLNTILQHPPLGDKNNHPWWGDLVTKELHEPTDKGRFVEAQDKGDYPVYGGANIHQFSHNEFVAPDLDSPRYWSKESSDPDVSARARIRQKAFNKGNLKKAIYTSFGGTKTRKSQKKFVNELLEKHREKELSHDDILPDYTEYRIGYRNVTNSTNERTMVAAVIPPGIACLETLQSFRPYYIEPSEDDLELEQLHSAYKRIFSDRALFVAVGLLNSIPFDFLMRSKIGTHIVKYKLEESQLPRLTDGDDWFHYISSRAARLNCYGEEFEEMRNRLGGIDPATDESERRELQAEIDAAAFHAYGLDREDTKFVLDDFHRVENPRLMDEPYFDMVLEKYDELTEEGPME